jgi:hypothetical protein
MTIASGLLFTTLLAFGVRDLFRLDRHGRGLPWP